MKLIASDLRREEMIIQLVSSLQQLDKTVDNVFTLINIKINSFQSTLKQIDSRADQCIQKVIQLKSVGNKALKVFSSYKYPTNEISLQVFNYKSINSINNSIDNNINKNIEENYRITSQLIPFDEQLIKDKMQFFNIKSKSQTLKDSNWCPMGSIPWHRIQSLSSLLIFNTSQNAYQYMKPKQSSLKSDSKRLQSRDERDSSLESQMMSAPNSMITPLEDNTRQLHFQFSLESAPQIMDSLPMTLPSLPGIADEFTFNGEDSVEIKTLEKQILLPNIGSFTTQDNQMKEQTTTQTTAQTKIQSQVLPQVLTSNRENSILLPSRESLAVAIPPPPPPPPPPPITPITPMTPMTPMTPTTTPIGVGPPPPPPPPPPLTPPPPPSPSVTSPSVKMNSNSSALSVDSVSHISMGAPDGRSSLLESIRLAAGKPKKSAKERKLDEKKRKQENADFANSKTNKPDSKSSGGDLMGDLMKRLALRRDGISGNQTSPKTPSNTKSNSAMDKVSAMIPPPVITSDNEETDSEDWID